MNLTKNQLIGLIVAAALLVGVLIFWVVSNNNSSETSTAENIAANVENESGDSIVIENISELDFMKDSEKSYLQEHLLALLADTSANAPSKGNISGKVRSDSISIDSQADYTAFTFIVDFAAVKKSWGVTLTRYLNSDGGDIGVYCLEPNQLIYGQFDCKDYGQDG